LAASAKREHERDFVVSIARRPRASTAKLLHAVDHLAATTNAGDRVKRPRRLMAACLREHARLMRKNALAPVRETYYQAAQVRSRLWGG